LKDALDHDFDTDNGIDVLLRRDLGLLTALRKAASEWREGSSVHSALLPETLRLPRRWEGYARALADEFKQAMASTNSTRLGDSADGPVARFIAAVIPLVFSETPSVQAVAQVLKRQAKRDKTKLSVSR
jgi:hypothetical protein